jgi:hypothetical protein
MLRLQRQATRICRSSNQRFARIPTPTSAAGAEVFVQQGIVVLRPQLRRLRRLRAPSDVADVYGAAVDALSRKLTALERASHTLKHGADPIIATKTLQHQLTPIETQEDNAWEALEIPACLNG